MKDRLGILIWVLALLVAAQPSLAQEGQMEPMEEPGAEAPSPLADPYEPEPGDPDSFASEDAPGEEPSPLNPADN